jgi:hypothetical protein
MFGHITAKLRNIKFQGAVPTPFCGFRRVTCGKCGRTKRRVETNLHICKRIVVTTPRTEYVSFHCERIYKKVNSVIDKLI